MKISSVIGIGFLVVLAFMASAANAVEVASWDFEEGVGPTVADGVGSLDATQTGGTWVTTGDYWGRLGNSLQVNRAEADTVLAPYASELAALTSMTVEMWVKSELPAYAVGDWVDFFTMPGCVQGYYHMAGVPVGNPQWRTIVGGWDTGYNGLGMLPLDTWTQVVVTYDGSTDTGTMYMNGTSWLYNSNTGTWGYVTGTGDGLDLSAAGNIGLSGGFNGVIDHYSIHDVALTDAEVMARYRLITDQSPSPGHQWALDEGEGTTAADSVSGFTGTLVNNASWTTEGLSGAALDCYDGGLEVPSVYTGTEMTIEMWMDVDADPDGTTRYLFDSDKITLLQNTAYNYTGGSLRFAGMGADFYPAMSLDAEVGWQQVVVTYAADDTITVYVDGQTAAAVGYEDGTDLFPSGLLNFASQANGDGPMDGKLDQITVLNTALTAEEVFTRYDTMNQDATPLPRPNFVLSAWGTHGYFGGEPVDMSVFDGSGLNTFMDDVRSGTETAKHPYTMGLPSLLMAYGRGPGVDLAGFIEDFNFARSRQTNIMGVILQDELAPSGYAHQRAVRDWIVGNADPTISSMRTIASHAVGADWDGLYTALQFDTAILQVYPFDGNTGAFDATGYYANLKWWSEWTKSKDVDMWVYTQNFAWEEVARQTPSELRLQKFAALAFGATGIVDFLWNYNPHDQWANGGYYYHSGETVSPNYPILAPINEEVEYVGEELALLDHISTHHRDDEFASVWADRPADWALLDVTCDDNGLLVGYFLDGDTNQRYFMIVNKDISKTLTPTELAVDVTLTFDPGVYGVERLLRSTGLYEDLTLVSDAYTFSLWGGTGDLFRFELLPGDVNGDGFVGGSDLNTILSNWGMSGATRIQGDLTGEGDVAGADYNLVLGNWGAGTPPEPAGIPEPATLSLLIIAGLAIMRRRR